METPSKESLITEIDSIKAETILWFENQSEENFNKEINLGKWTMAGHLYHLIKTTKGIAKGMSMPRLALRTAFGKCNRPERTFDEQHKKYIDTLSSLAASGTPVIPPDNFVPAPGRIFKKEELINRFSEEFESMKKLISKWKEKDLGIYVLPHPAMGKLTIREFIYFTIFHTKHHLDNLKENYTVD